MKKRKQNYSEDEQHRHIELTEEDHIDNFRQEMSEMRRKIENLYEENEYLSIKQNQFRARSITVGTAFGGIPEVVIRSDGATVHAQMQPTEVVELIEQLAAGIGVEIAMRPKENFASWRGWEEVLKQRVGFHKVQWKGAAAWQLDGGEVEEKYRYLTGNYIDKLESQDLSVERARIYEQNPNLLPDYDRKRAEKEMQERSLKSKENNLLEEETSSAKTKKPTRSRKRKVIGEENE